MILFLKDEGQRRFLCFLAIVLAMASVWAAAIWHRNGWQIKENALCHDRQVVSSLIAQGVCEEVIVQAFLEREITKQGINLLARMGMDDETNPFFLPNIWEIQKRTGQRMALLILFLWTCLPSLAGLFFSAREKLYLKAIDAMEQFMRGDFSRHLPRMNEGCLYRLFGKIDALATALSAKSEEALTAKDFLKDTISDISHQLKTPLSALLMYNEIIEAEIRQETGNREAALVFITKTSASLKRMEELIQALLKVTRLDAGAVIFEKQGWLLADVVSRAVSELLVRAKEEEKEIIFNGDEDVLVNCDLQWTSEAIGNLVKNALDYSERKTQIILSWEKLPELTRIAVANSGTGIDDGDIYHIFKRFYRSANNKRNDQGIGLGLPLAKSIVEGQGGTLSVLSTPGQGTVFTIMLPNGKTAGK